MLRIKYPQIPTAIYLEKLGTTNRYHLHFIKQFNVWVMATYQQGDLKRKKYYWNHLQDTNCRRLSSVEDLDMFGGVLVYFSKLRLYYLYFNKIY